VALDLTCRESMALDHRWRLARHCGHLVRLDLAPIQRPILAELPRRIGTADAMAKVDLAACIELQVSRKYVAILIQKADQSTVVIDMAMTEDQGLNLARVDPQETTIVDDRRGIAEVEQYRAVVLLPL